MEKTENIALKQPYAITLARHRLNVHEMRIMFRIVEALQPNTQYGQRRKDIINSTLFGNKIIRVPTKSLLPKGNKHYEFVRRAIKALRRKDITINKEDHKKGKSEVYTGLIVRGEYYHNNEFVEIEIDRDLLPCFLALAKNYSQYLLEVAFNSSSPNVMKLYQYISHWKDKPQIEVMIEDLREWLQLGDKYPSPRNFRVYILEPAIKELEAKSDIYFKINSPIKQGRRIIGWKLRIFRKALTDKEKNQATAFEQNIRMFLTNHFKLRDKDIEQFSKFIEKPELHRHIWDAMHRVAKRIDSRLQPIKNRRAYMLATLKNEFKEFLTDE